MGLELGGELFFFGHGRPRQSLAGPPQTDEAMSSVLFASRRIACFGTRPTGRFASCPASL